MIHERSLLLEQKSSEAAVGHVTRKSRRFNLAMSLVMISGSLSKLRFPRSNFPLDYLFVHLKARNEFLFSRGCKFSRSTHRWVADFLVCRQFKNRFFFWFKEKLLFFFLTWHDERDFSSAACCVFFFGGNRMVRAETRWRWLRRRKRDAMKIDIHAPSPNIAKLGSDHELNVRRVSRCDQWTDRPSIGVMAVR